VTLLGNGKSDVRNHFSTHRKSNLHLVSKETQPDPAGLPQEQVEVVNVGTSNPDATSDSQSAGGPVADSVPAHAGQKAGSRTPTA
jgi:hypothetical protein